MNFRVSLINLGNNNILIYTSMKAKEVMEKYGISRNTLSTWVKKEWIKVEILPSGRYRYKIIERKDVQSK